MVEAARRGVRGIGPPMMHFRAAKRPKRPGRAFAPALCLLALSACAPSPHDVIGRGDIDRLRTMLQENPALVSDTNELGKQPLQYAVSFGHVDAMEALVAAGADVNAEDKTGMTALHAAAVTGRREEARWLLDHGADLHIRDKFGNMPSHTAAIHNQGGVIEVLFKHGDPLTEKNNAGMTPLDLAKKHRNEKSARFIEKLIGSGSAVPNIEKE